MNFNNVKALHIPEGDVIRIQSGETVLWEKYFEQMASGEIITLNNSVDGNISGLSLFGKSTQNGTPTPTSPIPITNIVNPTIRTTGKNLFGGDVLADKIVSDAQGVKNTDNKTVYYKGSNVGGNKELFTGFKANTQYTFIITGYGDTRYLNLKILYTDGTHGVLAWQGGVTEKTTNKYLSLPNKTIDKLVGVYSSGGTYLYYDESGIFEGDITPDAYEPYKSGGSATINRTLCGIGDIKDELIVNKDGTGKFVQRIGHRTFDGSERWNLNAYHGSGDEKWARCTLKDTTLPTDATNDDTDIRVISDKLRGVTADADVNNHGHPSSYAVSVISNQRFSVWLAPPLDGIDKFKAWFRENNTTVQYELATPIETDLTAEEVNAILSLKTFEPTTVVMNDKGAEMTVRYIGTH